jgi:hypothetical protein
VLSSCRTYSRGMPQRAKTCTAAQPPRERKQAHLLTNPESWKLLMPAIIAHDVGRTKDCSTAVIGGISQFLQNVTCMADFEELPGGLALRAPESL